MAKITLDMWIHEALLDTNQDGRCTAISCIHKIGSADDEVYAVKIGEGTQWDPKQLADIFLHKAQSAVQDIPNSQSFYLYAFYGGRSQYQSKHHFRIDGGADLGHGQTEPATKEGSLSQGMRMAEAGFQFFHRQSIEMFRMSLESNQEMARQNRELMGENRELIGIFKEVLFERAATNHSFRMEELKTEQTRTEREFLMRLGPGILNAIAGKELIPQPVVDTSTIELMIEHLDEEAIAVLQRKFPPLLWATISARAAEHMQKKLTAQQTAAKVLEVRKDPILDDETSKAAE